MFDGLVDWLDSRTGIRTARKHLLDEPIPAGVGWWFVTGSVLILLLSVQLVTGIFLTMYYVPSPESAYDSVRYIMERVAVRPRAARAPLLRRQLHRHRRRRAHAARRRARLV